MPDYEREGLPPLENAPPGIDDVNEEEGLVLPGDTPKGATQWGVTAREEVLGEPLVTRRGREVPDRMHDDLDDGRVHGRLVQPDGGMVDVDDEPAEIADLVDDDAGLSAEEAALHITDTP